MLCIVFTVLLFISPPPPPRLCSLLYPPPLTFLFLFLTLLLPLPPLISPFLAPVSIEGQSFFLIESTDEALKRHLQLCGGVSPVPAPHTLFQLSTPHQFLTLDLTTRRHQCPWTRRCAELLHHTPLSGRCPGS